MDRYLDFYEYDALHWLAQTLISILEYYRFEGLKEEFHRMALFLLFIKYSYTLKKVK